MRFDLLASGSKGNSCLIRSGKDTILIDCGVGIRYLQKSLKEVGSSTEDIQAVLVTHTHSDHVRGLPWLADKPMFSYCDLTIKDRNRNILEIDHHKVLPLNPFKIGSIQVTPIALSHDSGPTAGFILEDDHDKLVYITDTGYVRHDFYPYMQNATYFIMESNHDPDLLMGSARPMVIKQRILSDVGHLNNADSARILACVIGPDTRQIVLAHISEEANTHETALDTLRQTLDEAGIARDQLLLEAAGQFEIITSLPDRTNP